jgi:hypothetical protein
MLRQSWVLRLQKVAAAKPAEYWMKTAGVMGTRNPLLWIKHGEVTLTVKLIA